MLKHDGQWEALTDRERLVLLSFAFELPKVAGLWVRDRDLALNSGLSGIHFPVVVQSLADKGLIRRSNNGMELAGDAFTGALGGIKVDNEIARRAGVKVIERRFFELRDEPIEDSIFNGPPQF